MAKKKTNAKKPRAAKVPDFAADDPLVMKGLWDSILKSLFDNVSIDPAKINRDFLKHGLTDFANAIKPAVSVPFDLDDRLIDGAVSVLMDLVDNAFKKAEEDEDIVVMGAKNYTKRDAKNFYAKFDNPHEDCCKKLERYPQTIATLEMLSEPNQERVMASPFLLNLLVIFGPMILQWVMDWLNRNKD